MYRFRKIRLRNRSLKKKLWGNVLKETLEDGISPLDPSPSPSPWLVSLSNQQWSMHFSVHVFVSVFLWLFFFACRVDQKSKSAQWHLEPSQKVRAQFEWASQSTWSVTTNKGNLSVPFTLNFSLSSYETIVRYAINLQTSLIWRKCFRGQEGLVIHYAVLPKSRPHIRASLNHLTSSSME